MLPVRCENCAAHFVLSPGDVSGATACPECGGSRFYRDQPTPTRSDGTLRDMVDSDSQKDQGGNPLGEGTIVGRDGEKPMGKRDNYMHSRVATDFDDQFVDSLGDGWDEESRQIQKEKELGSGATPSYETPTNDAGQIHILPAEASGNGRHNVMVIDNEGSSQWPTQYEPGRYGWDRPETASVSPDTLDRAFEYARALDRSRGVRGEMQPNPQPAPNEYGYLPYDPHTAIPDLREVTQHPDPWMDNEPGSLTLPKGPPHTWSSSIPAILAAGPINDINHQMIKCPHCASPMDFYQNAGDAGELICPGCGYGHLTGADTHPEDLRYPDEKWIGDEADDVVDKKLPPNPALNVTRPWPWHEWGVDPKYGKTAAGWMGNDPIEQGKIRCPNCGGEVMTDNETHEIFCTNCDHHWPVHGEMQGQWAYEPEDILGTEALREDHSLFGQPHRGSFEETVNRLEEYHDGVNGYGQGDPSRAQEWHNGDFRIGEGWFDGADGDPVPRLAGEMEDILGLPSGPTHTPASFLGWTPGMHGRGVVIAGEPHTWNAYDPARVHETGHGKGHFQYAADLGVNPALVDVNTGVEILPNGEVQATGGHNPTPFFDADPRLKPMQDKGDIFSIQPTPMNPTSRTLNTELYASFEHQSDVQFNPGAEQTLPPHSVMVDSPMGVHSRHIPWLKFLDAHVNGIPARNGHEEIVRRFGIHSSPEFGSPVQINVHDPMHIAPIVQQIKSSEPSVPAPLMQQLGHRIQSGELPPPPGIDISQIAPPRPQAPAPNQVAASVRTAGPALAIGGEALLGGGEAAGAGAAGGLGGFGLGDIAPALMKGALFRSGENAIGGGGAQQAAGEQAPSGNSAPAGPPDLSQLAAVLVSDYETPASNPDVGTKHDDPEDVDQKEFNDQDHNPSNHKNPNNEDSGASGEDEVRKDAGFGPDSVGIERMGLLLPLILHYFHSGDSGAEDPMIQGLHEVLEGESPGYLDNVTPEDEEKAKQFLDQLGKHQHEKTSKVALVPPMQNDYANPSFLQPQQPAVGMPPGGAQQQGHCPNCGGVLTADGSCPQCGAKQTPMGGSALPGQAPMNGGPSMPYQGSILAALVDSANHQGPVTPEQIAAVQQLLIKQHRVHEIPNVPLKPADYAREMAEIQNNPNVAPQVPQGEQTSPPAPQMGGAPGGMPMPGMAPGETGGAPMTPLSHVAADNIAGRCPRCNSATTGLLMDEGNHQRCHSCGNIWKAEGPVTDKSVNKETRVAGPEHEHQHSQNPIGVPAAEQDRPRDLEGEQDSSLSWKDEEGNPLQAGQEYEMHNPKYDIPDIIRVKRVKPDGLDVEILGEYANEPNALAAEDSISREEMQMEHLTFRPSTQDADSQGNEPPQGGQTTPGYQQVPPSGQTTDEIANSYPHQTSKVADINEIPEAPDLDGRCPRCGNNNPLTMESSYSSASTILTDCYECNHSWETRDDMPDVEGGAERSWLYDASTSGGDDFFAEMDRARAMAASGGMSSRSLSSIAAKDTRQQQISEYLANEAHERTAGRRHTPSEQRQLIDEDGTARNSDLLQLSGTHYKTRDDYTGKANGSNVPPEHLVLGL